MTITTDQSLWIRKATLVVVAGEQGLDLSQMHFKFKTKQSDAESPNTAEIRIYNLSSATVKQIQGEFTNVVLNAGYENGNFGIIFSGTIIQFRRGRENATDTYFDILASDSDIPYNNTMCNATIKDCTPNKVIDSVSNSMGLKVNNSLDNTGGVLPRGKVLWGLNRDVMRQTVQSQGATWSIQNGVVQVIPLQGYLPNEAVVMNSHSGMISLPEQTDEGIKVRSLLNPKLVIGGQLQINNTSINQTIAAPAGKITDGNGNILPGQLPFDKNAGLQLLADVSSDGFYRIYVVEFTGDTRGNDWYADMICLAIDSSSQEVISKN